MRQLLRRPDLIVLLVVVLVTTGGCVKPDPPGVSVAPLKADVVFGVKEATPPAAPPNFAIPQPEEIFSTDDESFDEMFDEKVLEIPDSPPLGRSPLATAATDCPAAELTAFPKESASVTVEGTPAQGVYRWKRSITVKPTNAAAATSSGFEQRVIRRVQQTPGKPYEFSYEVVQPDSLAAGSFVTTTFRVNSNPTVIQSVNQPPQTIGVVPVPGAEAYVQPPNDMPGIYLEKIVRQERSGDVKTFEPEPPLLYLPLEEGIVKQGQTFDTVGIDPRNSQAIRHTGTVLRKTRVDACGEIVEGWLVESKQTNSDDLIERKYFYNIATQMGALFIGENVEMTVAQGSVALDFSIANPAPQPLPDNLK